MSSSSDGIHSINVDSCSSFTDEDEFWLADVARAAKFDSAVQKLRVTAVAVAFFPVSCLCVVAGIWTSGGASVVVTRSNPHASEVNSSTTSLTLCCTRQYPSTPWDDCWISSDIEAADVQGLDAQFDADNRLRQIWRNVSAYFGCREALLPCHITPVNVKSSNCTDSSCYCVTAYCNATRNSSLLAGLVFRDVLHSGKLSSSSDTTWIASGLTTLAVVAVVGLSCIVFTVIRYHNARLPTAVAEMRVALGRRRSAAVDRCRCDRLLVDMLPPGVAESLKMGQTVEPETFDVASIYFSDIVGFNDVALNCKSPLVIVRLLNSVFR